VQGLFALGAVCTHDLAAFCQHETSLNKGEGRFIPAGPYIFDFQNDLYLSAPGLLVLCSDGAVILYFPTDYNLRSRVSREGVEYFTVVGSLIIRTIPTVLF